MKKKKNKSYSVIFTLIMILLIVVLSSAIFSFFEIGAQRSYINGDRIESSWIAIHNFFSIEGLQAFFGNVISNIAIFEPFFAILISLIGVGIAEKSGLLKIAFKPLIKWKPKYITFLVLLLGIFSSIYGEYSFALYLPLVAVLYQYLHRRPALGMIIAFLGLAMGYGTGFIFNYDTYALGLLTQLSAQIDVDPLYQFHLNSQLLISIITSLLLSIIGTIIIERFLVDKFSKNMPKEEEFQESRTGFILSLIAFVFLVIGVLYMIIPGIPGSGFLLDPDPNPYIVRLFGPNSFFADAFIYIVTIILGIVSLIYGVFSKNIQNNRDYGTQLGSYFNNLGVMFVGLFILSQIFGILNWTQLGEVIVLLLTDLISQLSLSGIFLILVFMIIVIISTIFIPSAFTKWSIMSPVIVPLFMRANITPHFAQFIFMISDGIGKVMTPFFVYVIYLLGLMQKYEEQTVTFGSVFKKAMPTILLFILLWMILLVGWYLIGLPIGLDSLPHL